MKQVFWQCVEKVCSGKDGTARRNSAAIAIVRPPGHHAHRDRPSGFCFLNNVAVAAMFAREHLNIARVLILDIDIHLGNGTLDCLRKNEDDGILYVSIHRSDEETFYPNAVSHSHAGRHVLIPFSGRLMGDTEYRAVLFKIVLPVVYSFNPSLLLLSAGMDALSGDPLGGYLVSPSTFALYTSQLQAVAPIVAVLEGGYNTSVLSDGLSAIIQSLRAGKLSQNVCEGDRGRVSDEGWHAMRNAFKINEKEFALLEGFGA